MCRNIDHRCYRKTGAFHRSRGPSRQARDASRECVSATVDQFVPRNRGGLRWQGPPSVGRSALADDHAGVLIGMVTGWTQVQRLGGTRLGVWAIKHVVAPLQLSLQRHSGGRLSLTGPAPVLLLTTVGRRTGKPRTVPAFYLREGAKYVVCNVRPPHEHTNPWVLNALANPQVRLTLHGETLDGWARLAEQPEVDRFWPALVQLWPAYRSFRNAGGDLSIFVIEADRDSARSPSAQRQGVVARGPREPD